MEILSQLNPITKTNRFQGQPLWNEEEIILENYRKKELVNSYLCLVQKH